MTCWEHWWIRSDSDYSAFGMRTQFCHLAGARVSTLPRSSRASGVLMAWPYSRLSVVGGLADRARACPLSLAYWRRVLHWGESRNQDREQFPWLLSPLPPRSFSCSICQTLMATIFSPQAVLTAAVQREATAEREKGSQPQKRGSPSPSVIRRVRVAFALPLPYAADCTQESLYCIETANCLSPPPSYV